MKFYNLMSDLPPNAKKITIVIPVYNAFDYLQPVVESVIKHSDHDYELLLIDDCSPDPRVKEYLQSIKHPNVKVLFNGTNLGFVGNCNRGLTATKNDTILLNSDTEVTAGWLSKLVKCAYSNPVIGTVTPLANNGAICSVPIPFQNNEIPGGYNKDTFNELIEHTSTGNTVEVPTGVGFCMYIKREVLDKVGLLDVETFGKGYGEENDFCLRTKAAGYINVIDESTFIYHKGNVSFQTGQSFSSEKMQILRERYPHFEPWIHRYIKDNPLKTKYQLIKFFLEHGLFKHDYKNVLHIKHLEIPIGGTGIHLGHLVNGIENYNHFVLYPHDRAVKLYIHHPDKGNHFSFTEELDESKILTFEDPVPTRAIELFHVEVITQIIKFFQIDLVHFQHLMGMSLTLLGLPQNLGLPSLLTVHDIYYFQENREFMAQPDSDAYLQSRNDAHKKYVNEQLNKVDHIIFPSAYLESEYKKYFDIKAKTSLIEHGIDLPKMIKGSVSSDRKLNIAYLGAATRAKGIETYFKLIGQDTGLFNWYIFGAKSHLFNKIRKGYGVKEGRDFQWHPYFNSNPQELLAKYDIDIIIFPGIIPESYSFTLSEAMQSGVAIIANNIGAIGQRVRDNKCGWIYSDISELGVILTKLNSDRTLLNKMITHNNKMHVKNLEEMSKDYQSLYDTVSIKNTIQAADSELIHQVNLQILANWEEEKVISTEPFRPFHEFKRAVRKIPIIGEAIYQKYKDITD